MTPLRYLDRFPHLRSNDVNYRTYAAISLKFSGPFEIRACFPGDYKDPFTESCVASTNNFGLKLWRRAERASESAYFAAFRSLIPNL